ncbi:MAG TPA: winged helix DNA-binding domain-containing protein [Mycobacteriales bacterium]|nr:winged helix DNA-binding domain-containing protein [Mycobacteriales bacterium]
MPTSRESVLAFRQRRQHLGRRLPVARLAEVAADCCGLRNSPPGSADAALAARLTGRSTETVAETVADSPLVEVFGPRLVPTLVRPEDVALLTVGTMPADERALADTVGPQAAKDLKAAGIGLADAVRQLTEAAEDELAAGPLPLGELSAAMTRRLPEAMSSWCPRCGSRHVREALFRVPGGAGVYRLEPRSGRQIWFALLDQPLRPDSDDAEPLRLELVRRFLRGYAPATPADFAGWTGTGPTEARRRWAALAPELADVGGASALAEDVPRLGRARLPEGVRLLPPGDPYLLARDRATVAPDPAVRALLWPSLAAPGAVLADGELVAAWRARKKGSTLQVTLAPFGGLPPPVLAAVEQEAARLAPHRSCSAATVTVG